MCAITALTVLPSDVTVPIATTIISASMTAYSVAVGPSSEWRKSLTRFIVYLTSLIVVPNVAIVPIATTIISASMTACSAAVGPFSERRKSLMRLMCYLEHEDRPVTGKANPPETLDAGVLTGIFLPSPITPTKTYETFQSGATMVIGANRLGAITSGVYVSAG